MRRWFAFSALFVTLLTSGCGSGVRIATTTPSTPAIPMVLLTLTFNGQTLTLELAASPTPSTYGPAFNFTVSATVTFANGTTCADGMEFYTMPLGGGGFADSCILGLTPYIDPGVQMFTGDVTAPTFTPGNYLFLVGALPGSLTIATIPSI
jgi:hypothetical protein